MKSLLKYKWFNIILTITIEALAITALLLIGSLQTGTLKYIVISIAILTAVMATYTVYKLFGAESKG
ncbi:hypothetical protein SY83_10210 [Paenibacillus swuensis]|uniref:Uncharacterized protein n=1 Tax=Paenibacillus swuensis TaxID=1178515 RepID=A0A172THQ1_9BACL|nr:hypothetical protein [Paenibacillus swuensis]ANE46585.1 hypothetical protein SY83_10210 [Paenibacillus swuensis]